MHQPTRTLPRAPAAATLALGLCLFAAATPGFALDEGARVDVRGIVTDGAGVPQSGLDITLVASREKLDLLRFSRQTAATVRHSARTNDRGEYALDWTWSRYYNRFTLEVGLNVRAPGGETVRTLYSQDITSRIRHTPVVVALTLADTTFIERYRAFVAGLTSAGERRVFDAMGAPDHVEVKVYPTHREVTWLYYPLGRSFLFRDGNLLQEIPFPPVPGGGSSGPGG